MDFGAAPGIADAMFHRSEILRRTGAPVILSLKHLALSASVDYGFLLGVIRRSAPAYRAIRIPKNTGGFRDLLSPSESLMAVQRWILHEVLTHQPRHRNNFAYFPGVTARECAARHAGAKWMIKTDLHNYFPSITEKKVFEVFEGLGYSRLVAFELARLCTWTISQTPTAVTTVQQRARSSTGLPYPVMLEGVLPQGAPTSGALANASTFSLDEKLSDLAIKSNLVYTRYSDDMTFSSASPLDRDVARLVIRHIRTIVGKSGLELHDKKTKLIPHGARKIVLGMLITEDGVSVLPEQRRMIDLHIHAVGKFGPVAYATQRRFESVLSFVNHVEGWLAYLSHIDRDWTAQRRLAWNAALDRHHVSVMSLG
ncbi:reverse transcriptase family protein [Glaciihabitans tibetensis]|uniref:reverse transcriptase family protein n=1 Tax=Glaciihabitans tibetensis TaxID=1266600 RepID=UPI000D0774C9|nr:reverse transcriptase family protein [Glaciihabitans tibetensis]